MDWRRFNRAGTARVLEGKASDETLGSFLKSIGVGRVFRDQCLIPLAASVWSSPDEYIVDFPAMSFLHFFHNHGLLNVAQFPQWQTIEGGSQVYVQAFATQFQGTVRLGESIVHVERADKSAMITFADGDQESFYHLVLAQHADTALALLKSATPEEQ